MLTLVHDHNSEEEKISYERKASERVPLLFDQEHQSPLINTQSARSSKQKLPRFLSKEYINRVAYPC